MTAAQVMKDFLGREIVIGDEVIVIEPKYRNLCRGRVTAFTPKSVRVEYTPQYTSPLSQSFKLLQYPDQLVVIPKESK